MDSKPRINTFILLLTCKKRAFLLFLVLLFCQPFQVFAGKLIDMNAVTAPDGSVQLRLTFDGPAPAAKGYNIEQPPRLSIDLPGTGNTLPKYNELGFDAAQSVTILETGNRTRLVVSQKEPKGFVTRKDGSMMLITIGGAVGEKARTTLKSPSPYGSPNYTAQLAMAAQSEGLKVRDIDFKRGDDEAGNVIITLSDAGVPVAINEVSGRILLEFKGEAIPEKLRNRLDVTDFGTPVKFIDTKIKEGNAVITIEPKGGYDYLAYQTDNKLTISVKSEAGEGYVKSRKGIAYRGDKVSFNFQNIEVRTILQLIADINNMNLVASDTVTGNVTLRLKNVPWDHALDIVLKAKGLDKRMAGNVMTVAPAAEIAAREKEQLENEKQIRELAPVYTDLLTINYADAKELSKVIGGGGDDGGKGLLTEQGSIQVVERTNSLLIKDTQEKLDEIRSLVEQMDIPVRQVLIEARIVTLSSNYTRELGVKWSGGKGRQSDNSRTVVGGRGTGFEFVDTEDPILTSDGFDLSKTVPTFDGSQVFTDLSVAGNTAAALGIGFVTNGTLLNLELSALISDGGGEVVSQPKVITADKQKALIKAGKQIPYTEASSSGAATVSFQDAVLSLEVTPQITPEGRVILDIKVTNDDSTETASNGVPIIDKNEITTQVLVNDGETVVLGGVFKQTQKNNVDKVPLLGDIPYLGHLFRKKTSRDDKSELMVFITPRVIEEGTSIN
ncbi:type IV pilus secretin PilQ family protein [Candidatus Sororendozoicomonas aggregata]|uniref:type IV pilus secretin PilQ n=1 Tax=Candidatus Sororendozoicomonas aggregata TaxID=3073239 RepID=UPI002ED0E107